MKKSFFCKFILLFLFIILIFTIKSYAAESDFTYKLDSNNYAIITSYKGSNNNITIPNIIDGHEVKQIDIHAFHDERNDTNGSILTNVIISEGITTVGDYAFTNCTNLKSVTLPETLTSLGSFTFLGCSKLNSINIPSNLKELKLFVFQDTDFSEFTIPEHIERIGSCAFRSCPNLKSFKVYSKNVIYDDQDIFQYCPNDLILYGYGDSTTQAYAQQNGLKFRNLSTFVPVKSLTLDKTDLSLHVGDSQTLLATILPDDATEKDIIWSTSDSNIATVENGKVTAVAVGSVTITASTTDGTVKATCNITITPNDGSSNVIPVTSITLNKTSLSLYIGDSQTLLATILPDDATNKDIIWSTSDSNIATVENGKVTAVAVGSVTITASTTDGTLKATCDITVKKLSDLKSDSKKVTDNTVSTLKLPQTGFSNFILILLFIISILALIFYKYYKKLKKYKI